MLDSIFTLDESKIPDQLETLEDYKQVMENFVLPLMQRVIQETVNVIVELEELCNSEREISQEQLDLFTNKMCYINSFANEDGPMYPYMKAIVDLETRLEAEGCFDAPQ